jgi:hypothetical protein
MKSGDCTPGMIRYSGSLKRMTTKQKNLRFLLREDLIHAVSHGHTTPWTHHRKTNT